MDGIVWTASFGRHRLDGIVWMVAVEQIHDTAKRAEKGIILSLEEYECAPGKAIELKANNTGTHYHLDLRIPDKDLLSFEVPPVQGKWPKHHGLKLILTGVEEKVKLQKDRKVLFTADVNYD